MMTEGRPENPYPGLRPYRDEEEIYFFGREHQVDQMVDTLSRHRFLSVIGPSGCGKSSLVNCGLIPALHRGRLASAGTNWRVARFRPGASPVQSMAVSLSKKGVLFEQPAGQFSMGDAIAGTLHLGREGLVDVAEQARLEGVSLLVVVDQFEEVFRFSERGHTKGDGVSKDAREMVNLLISAAAQQETPIYIVLTMRSDFLGDCAAFEALPAVINRGQYLVPRMTREERRAAIERPARVVGARVSDVLVTRLLNDVGDNPDQLSILQHALSRTFRNWCDQGAKGSLDLANYTAIGTMARALNDHAEATFSALPSDADRAACERLFKVLTDRAWDARGIRRPTRFSALCDITGGDADRNRRVIDHFRAKECSFLMPPPEEPLSDDVVVDIAHESLMRIWTRLDEWTVEEAHSVELYQRLKRDAELYGENARSLWRGPELAVGLRWQRENRPTSAWAARFGPGFDQAMAFLGKARAWARVRALGVVMLVLLVLAAAGAMAYTKMLQTRVANAEAKNQQLLAKKAEDDARHARERAEETLQKMYAFENENKRLERKIADFVERNPTMRAQVQALRKKTRERILDLLEVREENLVLADKLAASTLRKEQLQTRVADLTEQNRRLIKKKDKAAAEKDKLTKQRAALETAIAALETTLNEKGVENDTLRTALVAKGYLPPPFHETLGTGGSAESGHGGQIGYAVNQTKESFPEDRLAELKRKNAQLRERLDRFAEEARLLEMLEDELTEWYQKVEQKLAEANATKADLTKQLGALRHQIKTLTQKESKLIAKRDLVTKALNTIIEDNNRLTTEIEQLKWEKTTLDQAIENVAKENKMLRQMLKKPTPASPKAG